MEIYKAVVLTEAASRFLSKAVLGDGTIEFTRVVTGDGVHAEGENQKQLTRLTSEKQSFPVLSKEIYNEKTVILKSAITNIQDDVGLQEGYVIREIGIYARLDDGDEVLYATVLENPEIGGDYMPGYNGLKPDMIELNWFIEVSDSGKVSIQGGAGVLALASDVRVVEHRLAAAINQLNTVVEVNVPAAGWTGAGSNFMNRIQLNGFSNDDRPEVLFISDLFETDSDTGGVVLSAAKLATLAARKKAFACLSGAVVSTEGLVIFASKRPAVDFKIGLKGGAARDYEPNDSDGGEPGDGRELSENSLSEIWDTV